MKKSIKQRWKFNFRRYFAVLHARNLEFIRDRSALSWNIAFPFLIVLGFAFAFTGDTLGLYKIGVYNPTQGQNVQLHAFLTTRHLEFVSIDDVTRAITKVERHQLDMLLDIPGQRYWINHDSPKGYLVERILIGSLGNAAEQAAGLLHKQAVSGKEVRYVDWVVPGVLALNIMFSALFGVGYVIVRYRKNGVLKRLKATPLSALEFLAAQVSSRFILIMAASTFVFTAMNLILHFTMHGSYLTLLLVFALGTLCVISMGLLIAARLTSEEMAGGLLNMVSWPMMFLSGAWFSLEGVHAFFQGASKVIPLTHIIDAARAIMLDGAGISDILPQISALLIMTLVFLAIGAYSFRWE